MYLFIWCYVHILLLYVLACRQRATARGHGSVAAVNKKQRHQSDKAQQLMPADMHQLAAKTNRDALARSSRQLDKMYRLGRGTSKLSRNHRMRASDERVYLRVEEAFLPTCYWCQVVLSNYWRLFFLVLLKLYECQVKIANSWRCYVTKFVWQVAFIYLYPIEQLYAKRDSKYIM
jgi:hypothetical protein